jgi:hypothetical protein
MTRWSTPARAGQTDNFVCDLHLTECMVGTLRVTK